MPGWIPLMQNVFSNRRVVAAANELTGGDVEKIVGHLARLWTWALDHREDGSLAGLDDVRVAAVMGWPAGPRELARIPAQLRMQIDNGTLTTAEALAERTPRALRAHAQRIVSALRHAELLTPESAIHDWDDYVGILIQRRKRDRERKRKDRDEARKTGRSPSSSVGRPQDSRDSGPQDNRGVSPQDIGPVSSGQMNAQAQAVRTHRDPTVPESDRTVPSTPVSSGQRDAPLASGSAGQRGNGLLTQSGVRPPTHIAATVAAVVGCASCGHAPVVHRGLRDVKVTAGTAQEGECAMVNCLCGAFAAYEPDARTTAVEGEPEAAELGEPPIPDDPDASVAPHEPMREAT